MRTGYEDRLIALYINVHVHPYCGIQELIY